MAHLNSFLKISNTKPSKKKTTLARAARAEVKAMADPPTTK